MADLVVQLTDIGKAKAFDADQGSFKIQITHLQTGVGIYDPTTRADATALVDPRETVDILSSDTDIESQTITVHTMLDSEQEYWVREVGLLLSDGTLFAVWSHPEPVVGFKSRFNKSLLSFSLRIVDVNPGVIEIVDQGIDLDLNYAPEFLNLGGSVSNLAVTMTKISERSTQNTTRIDALETRADTVGTDTSQNTTRIDALENRADTVETDTSQNATRIDALENRADTEANMAQNAASIDALETRADSVETDTSQNTTRIDALETRADTVETDTSQNTTRIDALETRADNVETGTTQNTTRIDALETRADTVETDTTQNTTRIDALETRADTVETDTTQNTTRIDALETRTDTVETDTTQNTTRIDALETRADTVETDTTQNTTRIDALETRADTVETDTTQNTTRIDALETRADTVETDTTQNTTRIDALETRADTVETDTTQNTTRIDALETRADTVETDTTQNTTRIDALETRADTVETDTSQNTTSIGDLTIRVEALEAGGDPVTSYIYALGGYNGGWLDFAARLNLATKQWETLPNMPRPRYGHVAVRDDDKIYVIAGLSSTNPKAPELLNLGTLTWSPPGTVASINYWERTSLVAGHYEGKIYIFGGDQSGSDLVEVYDQNSWSSPSTSLHDNLGEHAGVVIGEKAYLIGGAGNLRDVDIFNMRYSSNELYMPQLNIGRRFHTAVLVDNKIYVMGGNDETNDLNSMEVYDFTEGAWWSVGTAMPWTRSRHTAVAVGHEIYVIGGIVGGSVSSSVDIYNAYSDTWSSGPAMPIAAEQLAAVI